LARNIILQTIVRTIFIQIVFLIEVRINRGKITNCYVCFFIINARNLYPNTLVVRIFFIKRGMGGDALPNVSSYPPILPL